MLPKSRWIKVFWTNGMYHVEFGSINSWTPKHQSQYSAIHEIASMEIEDWIERGIAPL